MNAPTFQINEFEYHCYRREHEIAGRALLSLLERVDQNYGVMADIDAWAQSDQAREIMDEHLTTRLAAAITTLVTDANFTLSDFGMARLAPFQRWLSSLFAVTPFRNADHILRSLGTDPAAKNTLQMRAEEVRKFQLFYLTDSEMLLDWDMFWRFDKVATANLAISILSTRVMASPPAHQKREMLLRWLPGKLEEVDWDRLPSGVLHDAYMHCSYADLPSKHDIKRSIDALIRRKLESLGLRDVTRKAARPDGSDPLTGGKPVLLVVLEWFSKNHSIYRTHSQTMIAMRDKFHLIGMGYDGRVDEVGRELFHEYIPLEGADVWEHVAHVREVSEARNVQVMYMPSLGMFPSTMILANLRVAPLQMMALGHPATSHGHAMDYVVVEEDYVGEDSCFSEKLLKLPKDGMPYRPPTAMLEMQLTRGLLPPPARPDTVRVAVAATIIKLNPGFLETCGQIVREARVPVEFHFLIGQASGLTYPQVRNIIHQLVGREAVVHQHQNYDRYMQIIADCDLFLNPFPFGNTNGIVDTVWAGLVGVNKTGPEVHEHIDEGMFGRLGLPQWMTARTREDYKTAALRLIHDREERLALARQFAGPKAVQKLIFKGRPQILGERITALWKAAIPKTGARASQSDTPTVSVPMKPSGRRLRAVDPIGVPDWLAREVEAFFAVPLRTTPKVILDIGANIGAFSRRAHQEWPEAKVIAYEPLPSNLASLRGNLDPAWAEIVPHAVRAEAGPQDMFLGDIFVTGGFDKGERQTINRITVDCVAARDLPPCDLVKIHTEGSEAEILSHMDLAGVNAVMLEFHSRQDAETVRRLLADDFDCLHDEPDKAVGTMIFQRRA
ncbi:MAG: FkbM family methyltransferase [Novosphingobium sp.]|jgi:FkbM family methyltransferase|nr:FkbM family methyltransferase [Novosphingobium sp.]